MKGFFWMPFPPGPLLIGTLESRTAHVLLCFIIPILWNYYSPGVSLQLAKGDSRERTHDLQSPTYLLTLSSLWQPGVCVCVCASHSLCVCWFLFWFFFVCLFVCCYKTRKSLLRLPPLARVSSCFVSWPNIGESIFVLFMFCSHTQITSGTPVAQVVCSNKKARKRLIDRTDFFKCSFFLSFLGFEDPT